MSIRIRRSTLIFPVNVPRFIEKAYTRGADAISLDLEDSVPPAEKPAARTMVKAAIALAARGGAEVLVRINNDPDLIIEDVDAAAHPGLFGIHFPKVESAEQMHRLDALLEAKEKERNLPLKSITISAHIETPLGLLNAESIATASQRIESLSIGPEDYCFELGVEPSEDGLELLYPVSQVVTLCKAYKLRAHGLVGSVAGFRDLDSFERAALRGVRLVPGDRRGAVRGSAGGGRGLPHQGGRDPGTARQRALRSGQGPLQGVPDRRGAHVLRAQL